MTTEEKAKAYDEALKWMRELYPGLHGATKEDAEHYFPELRESEDERIRRELIEYLRGDLDDITTDDTDRWIAWIEKQKEQKPAWSEDEELENEISKSIENLEGCSTKVNGNPEYHIISDEGLREFAHQFAKWGADHTPLPEDTVLFNKGVAEGKRLMMDEWLKDRDGCFWDGVEEGKKAMKDAILAIIESRLSEIIGDAQPKPILRAELEELINKIKK